MRKLLAIMALVALPLHLAAAGDPLTRTSDERSVKVEVTPLNFSNPGVTLDFRVVMETHAVELDQDLTKISLLRDDRGNSYRPSGWKGPVGGHHVQGVLHFAGGAEILKPLPGYLELHIDGIAGTKRVFRWESHAFGPGGKIR